MLVRPLFLPLPPTFPEPQRSGLRQGQSLPEVRGPWKSSPFFIWSRPPVAMVTQHLLPNSALAVTWAWHPPSCCWFCVLPNVLLCSLRNASPFFRGGEGNPLIQKAWRQGRLNLCTLQFEKASSRMRGAINSASLWINVLYLSISNPAANSPPRFILLAFVSKGHTLFIKIPINM